jgi:hypothetical protein
MVSGREGSSGQLGEEKEKQMCEKYFALIA